MVNFIADAYKEVANRDQDEAARFQSEVEKAVGQTFDEFKQQQAALGMNTESIPFTDFIKANSATIAASAGTFQALISNLVNAGVATNDLAKSGETLANSWQTANTSLESAGSGLRQMLQAALEAEDDYYKLDKNQQNVLSQFMNGIDGTTFGDIGDNTQIPLEYTKAMLKVISSTEAGSEAVAEFNNLTSQRGNLTVQDYDKQADQIMTKLQIAITRALPTDMQDYKIDLSKVFGIEDFQKKTEDLKSSIQSTLTEGLDNIVPGGTFTDIDPEKMQGFQELYDYYKKMHDEMKTWNVSYDDVNKGVFGNVDFNKRDAITWTDELLGKYKSQLQSIDSQAAKQWGQFVNDVKGQTSTALGASGEFGENQVPIAYTPLLQTDKGLEPLNQSTIDKYLSGIVDTAQKMPGATKTNIFDLDAKGIMVDGKKIQNIIADVGDTAEETSHKMHFAGPFGDVALTSKEIQEACDAAGATTQDFFAYFTTGSEKAKEALAGVETSVKGLFDFDYNSLTSNQLQAFHTIMENAGTNVARYAAQLQAIQESGHLPEFLDEFNKKLGSQSDALRTVGNDLDDYNQKMSANPVNGAETHESMVEVFDSLKKAVNKGQINTEDARTQMDLLIGKVVDLKEAKKWIKENEGFFLTGNDDDKVGQDLTGGFNTLHKKYNALSKDNKELADSLMTVDWQHGNIQVAQHDVSKLADLFGMSTASLQQFFDLVSTYSNPTKTDISTIGDGVKQLNSASITANSKMQGDLKNTEAAWDSLTGAQKRSLEAMTEGTSYDPSQMTTAQIESYTNAWNAMTVAVGGAFNDKNVETYFKSLGDGVATVQRLSDGTQHIDVKNVQALADELSKLKGITITEADTRNMLAAMNNKTLANGDKYTFTVNGEQAVSETSKVQQCTEDLVALFDKKYGLQIDTLPAMKSVEEIKSYANSRFSNMSYAINFTMGSVPSAPVYSATATKSQKEHDIRSRREGNKGQEFTGRVGRMTQYASGGNATGGKTLVGELGPEQWISRDGKHSKFVGLHGMEVIDTKPGDAIVPANLTAGLIHSGMRQAYDGADSSGALDNLKYGTNGKYYNWKGSTTKKKSKSKSSSSKKYTDAEKEALDKLKEEVEELIAKLEHKIYIAEETKDDPYKIVAYYKQIQEEAHKAAEQFRAKGAEEDSEWIRNMQKQWKQLPPAFVKSVECVFITPKSIELLETPKAI